MISQLLIAWVFMAFCVAVHAAGISSAMHWTNVQREWGTRFCPWTWLFIRAAAWMILCHLVETTFWGLLYFSKHAMPDLASSRYFSAVTYTTTGYGDLVLPPEWRLVGGVEALTGSLMCGLSTGFFFAVVGRAYGDKTV